MESSVTIEALVAECKAAFTKKYGKDPSVGAFAPGRVNIIGEHTDYNDGFVMPMAVPLVTVVVGSPNDDGKIRIFTLAKEVDEPHDIEISVPTNDNPLEKKEPKWANYMKGVIQHFPCDGSKKAFDAVVITTVPLGGGLSSSASLEVATCTFLEELTSITLKGPEKALLCQKAEHTYANVPCGIMDQFISCMGKKNSALLIDCRSLDTEHVDLSLFKIKKGLDVSFLVVNSNVKHQLSGSEYPQRKASCMKSAEILGIKSLREANLSMLREKRNELGDEDYQRSLHVVTEIERCQKAVAAIKEGDEEEFGRLMYQSHVSLRDLYQVSCKELDELVEISMKTPGVYGARMTGGGFGGCIVILAETSQLDNIVESINAQYSGKAKCYNFNAFDGAQTVKLL